jgi:hypothetical protein
MVDESPPPPAGSGPDRRRPAPVIDLEATEIVSRPLAGEPAPGDRPAAESDAPSSAAPAGDAAASASEDKATKAGASVRWPLVGGAVAGAAAVLAGVAVTLWIGGGTDTSALDLRIGELEHQVASLAARPATDAATTSAVGELTGRLGKLEAQVVSDRAAQPRSPVQAAQSAAPDQAVQQRMAALETALKTLGERLDRISQRDDSAAATSTAALNELAQKLARADASGAQSNEAAAAAVDAATATIADLTARIDALEAGAKALAAEGQRATDSPDDRALRAAIIASSLLSLVERGRPFAAELKAAQAQAADASALAPLEGFAATGVPLPGILTRELTELLPTLQRAAGHPDGFLDKLEANAERLVRIRPIEQAEGNDPAAIISRVEFKALHGGLRGALELRDALNELGTLPANVRAPAQAWIDKAQAATAALVAGRAFAADSLAALGKSPR